MLPDTTQISKSFGFLKVGHCIHLFTSCFYTGMKEKSWYVKCAVLPSTLHRKICNSEPVGILIQLAYHGKQGSQNYIVCESW